MSRQTVVRTLSLSIDDDVVGSGNAAAVRTDGGQRARTTRADDDREYTRLESGDGSHHPGPPRFTSVGEGFVDPNGEETETRDDLAPWNPDPDADYEWRVADAPEGSTAEPAGDAVVDFVPDVPGEYTLELDAPDGTHELTVRAYPEEDDADPRPRVRLDAEVVGDRLALTATASVSDDRTVGDPDLDVEFFVDDRDRDAIPGGIGDGNADADEGEDGNGTGNALSIAELEEPVRIYAVAVGDRHSVPDAIQVTPTENGIAIERPFAPPEWVSESVVYEIFTRRFPDQDDPTFSTIADRLDHLERLGVDVLWMTPIVETLRGFGTPEEKGGPHGYHTTDYFEPDPDLGSIEEFEAMVEAAHERDIRVVFDLVINHTAVTHPFCEAARDPDHPDHEQYRDWYRWEDEAELVPETYFGWSDIPNLAFSNPAVRAHLLDVVDFWAEKVDGFRCDVAWGVPKSFWLEVHDRVTRANAEFFLLDETLPGYDVEMGAGRFHVHHDDALHEALRDASEDGAEPVLEAIENRYRKGAHSDSLFLQYIENHDTDRYLGEHPASVQRAAGAATFTLPGIPMIYYGQETGMTDYREPMNWDSIDEDALAFYRRLVELEQSHPALGPDPRLERVDYRADGTAIAYARHDPETDRQVVVLLNFGEEPTTVEIGDFIERTDLLTGSRAPLSVRNGTVTVDVDDAVVIEADEPVPVPERGRGTLARLRDRLSGLLPTG